MNAAGRVGRMLLGAPFVWLGWQAFAEPGQRVAIAADFGMPQPEMAVRGNGMAMVLGGIALATGVSPRAAAAGLAASLVPTTLAGHAFWKMEDPQARASNRIQFAKNLGLIGGLLATASHD